MKEVITIFVTLIIFCGVIAIIYIYFYNNIQAIKVRINEAESIIDDLLRKKYDLLLTIKNIIVENTEVVEKTFNNLDTLKEINISSFDFERKLTETNTLISQIVDDNISLKDNNELCNCIEDIFQLNEKLEATKTFFNKYTSLLNKAISSFPSNIIGKIHHIGVNTFFDGKDFKDEIITDFKL